MDTGTAVVVVGGLAILGVAAFLIVKMKRDEEREAREAAAALAAGQDPLGVSEERRVLGGVKTAVGGAFGVVEGIFEAVGL